MNNIQNIYEESRYKILFNEFYPALVQFAFSFINNEEAAKDIVQEIFIRIWEKRSNLKTNYYCVNIYTFPRKINVSLIYGIAKFNITTSNKL